MKVIWDNRELWERAEVAGIAVNLIGTVISTVGGGMLNASFGWGLGAIIGGAIVFLAGGVLTIGSQQRIKAVDKELARQAAVRKSATLKRVVQAILDTLRDEYFTRVEAEERYQHRVTLFLCEDVPGGKGRRLSIYARAGVGAESAKANYRVDDAVEGNCEGIAGRIWFRDATLTFTLPPWSDSDSMAQQKYADEGFLTVERVRQLNVKSEAFTGATVRSQGQRWGALLLDSRTASGGYISEAKQHIVNHYALLLGKVIQEGLS